MSEVVGKEIVTVFDPELVRDNAVEEKHSMLIRAIKRRPAIGVGSDRELKPNAEERHQIRAIIHYPPTQKLDDKEKEMVWKFRYYLVNIKKAFTKFVKSVDWSHPYERSEGQQLIQRVRAYFCSPRRILLI
jgi:phosphatidylinositol 3-kinase